VSHNKWISACGVVMLTLASVTLFAIDHDDDHGQGHGRGQGKHKGEQEKEYRYSDHDRDEMRGWYGERGGGLPPGLAKRDQLPPGLERQLRVRGTLPPGLQKKIQPCPVELVRRLPPPPPYCDHVLIGGHIVLLNRRTNIVLDIFHFER